MKRKEKELYSAAEVAAELGVTRQALYIAMREGRLTASRTRPHLFTRSAIEDYARNQGKANGYKTRMQKKLSENSSVSPLQ